MHAILAGESSPALTASFLTALRMKGETVEELAGFARAMRAVSEPLPVSASCRPLLDTCGTGGNGIPVFNVSTAAAFVAAGAGVHVAKHGNRSISSKCGSADVLEALGIKTAVPPATVAREVEEAGIGFLFAPAFHLAVKHVQPVRLELKLRTVFNYLGTLSNPAGAELQLVGTGSAAVAEKLANALVLLGLQRGFVVSGSDGLGEVTVTGPSTVFSIANGQAEKLTLTPADFGLPVSPLEALGGGDRETNRAIIEAVLGGETGARRDIVVMNAALALIAAGKAAGWHDGARLAEATIDSGAALAKVRLLAKVSNAI